MSALENGFNRFPLERDIYISSEEEETLRTAVQTVAKPALASLDTVRTWELRGMPLDSNLAAPESMSQIGPNFTFVDMTYQYHPNDPTEPPQLEVMLHGHPLGDTATALLNEDGSFTVYALGGSRKSKTHEEIEYPGMSSDELLGVIPGLLGKKLFDGPGMQDYADLGLHATNLALLDRLSRADIADHESVIDTAESCYMIGDSTVTVSLAFADTQERRGPSGRRKYNFDKKLELATKADLEIASGQVSERLSFGFSTLRPGDRKQDRRSPAKFKLSGPGLRATDPNMAKQLEEMVGRTYLSKERTFGRSILYAAGVFGGLESAA